MLLLRYFAAIYLFYCHGQLFGSAIPVSELVKCPWEDSLTMINKMSLPRSHNNTALTQNTKKISRARNHPIQFNKRVHMYEHRDIEVEIHYHCPIVGRGYQRFAWSVVWDSDYPDIQYYAITNIGGFPDEDKTWDDDTYPAPFTGSWWWHDHEEYLAHRHMCKKSYTAHFEGQVDFQGISIFLIDRPTDALRPKIFEQCRGRSGDADGGTHGCASWTISTPCQFVRAVVLGPRSPPH